MTKGTNHESVGVVDNKLALKSGIIYLIAEFFTRGISFLTTPIFTRLLPRTVFADVKIFESWVYLFAPILSLTLYQSIFRAKFDYEKQYDSYLSNTISLMTFITLGVLGGSIFFVDFLEKRLEFDWPLLLLMLAYSLAYNSTQCIQLHERQLMHYKSNVALTMLAVIPSVIISLLFVLKFSGTVSNEQLLNIRIVSFFLPPTLIGFVVMLIFVFKGRSVVNLDHWKYAIKYSVPMIAVVLSSQIFYQSANIIVRKIVGADAAAIVALAMTVGYIMDILIHAVDNAWRPWLYEQLNAEGYQQIRKLWLPLFAGVALFMWCLTMLAPELVLFLGGAKYADSVWLISPILCGSLANFLMVEYSAIEQYYKKTRISGFASIFSALVNIALNIIFIYEFGYRAAAYTTAAAYLIACGVHYLFIRKFEKNDILMTRRSVLIIVSTFAVCLFTTLLFGMGMWMRCLIIIVVLLSVAIVKRKSITDMMLIIRQIKQ